MTHCKFICTRHDHCFHMFPAVWSVWLSQHLKDMKFSECDSQKVQCNITVTWTMQGTGSVAVEVSVWKVSLVTVVRKKKKVLCWWACLLHGWFGNRKHDASEAGHGYTDRMNTEELWHRHVCKMSTMSCLYTMHCLHGSPCYWTWTEQPKRHFYLCAADDNMSFLAQGPGMA